MFDQGNDATTRVLDLLDALPIMILDVDERGTLQFANRRVRERLGLPAELEDVSLSDILDASCRAEAISQLRDLFGGENDITSTWKLKTRAGGLLQAETNAVTIYDNGNPFRVRFYLYDGMDTPTVTGVPTSGEAGELKAALKEEQEYTKALIQKSGLLVYILDTRNAVVEINKKMEEVTGFTRESAPDLDALLAGLYPDAKYRAIVERIHQNMFKNQHIRETELSISTQNGEVKHVSWSTARLKNARGQVHGFIAMGMEVSEKKRLEQWVKLQSSCFDRVSDGVVVSDLRGQIINWVGGAERLLGFTAKDMTGKAVSELFPPEHRAEISRSFFEGIERESKWVGELTVATQDSRRLAIRFESAVILNEKGAPIAIVSVLHDLTRDRSLEKELQEDREELSQLNRLIESREKEAREANSRVEELERRVEYFSNKNRDLEMEASRFASGRMALESAIKDLQIYQLQIVGIAAAAIITTDPSGMVTSWSKGAEELTGLNENQAAGRHLDEVFKLDDMDWELIYTEALQKTRIVLPCSVQKGDGEKAAIQVEAAVLTDDGGQPIAFTMAALPPQQEKQVEVQVPVEKAPDPALFQELFEARNMSLVGELTAGVARDLADSFSALHANLRRLQEYTTDLKKVVELYRNGASTRDVEAFVRRIDLRSTLNDLDFLFDESTESLVRIRSLAQDVEAFVPTTDAGGPVALNDALESTISLIRADLQGRSRIEKNYAEPVHVSGSRNMIMRLVLSLLTVSLKSFEQANPSRNEVRVRTTLDGNLAMVEISQNGRALPPEVVQNLGDFTRLASIGGELALNMGVADQLATSLGGTLAILNAPDGSTVFRLSLPTADGDLSLLQREPDRGEPSGNVFFIDDDKNQLRSYRRYFEKSFHIFQAEDVEAAQNALSIRQDFNAIVMDLLLPESNGLALLRHIGERYQRLMDKTVVLVPPGLSRETIKAIKASNAMMLYKPVELDSLGSVLSHVVRRSSSKKS